MISFFNEVKKNACKFSLVNMLTGLFSLVLSFSYTYGRLVNFKDLFGTIKDNYIREFTSYDLILLIVLAIVIYIIINILTIIWDKYINKLFIRDNKKLKIPLMLIFAIIIFISWIPYLLTYYPGCVYYDALTSMKQVIHGGITNNHTYLYTCFLGLFALLGKSMGDYNIGIFIYTLIQCIVMSLVLSYSLKWMYKNNINIKYIALVLLVYMFFPLFPYYAITVWKDTYFSLSLFLYIIFLVDFIKGNKCFDKVQDVLYYLILNFFVCFLRNNGVFVVIFTFIFFVIFNFKDLLKKYKYFTYITIGGIILVYSIQGPFYAMIQGSTLASSSRAITTQVAVSVVVNEGNYEEEKEFIEKIWDIDELKEKYTPCLADTVNMHLDKFDLEYLNKNNREFLNIVYKLAIKNPDIAINAFLLENLGFWHLTYATSDAYIQDGVWVNDFGLKQTDVIKNITGKSLSNLVRPKFYISSGLLFFMTMLVGVIVIKMTSIKRFLPFVPILGLWGIYILATPIAFSLRYIYIVILMLPLLPILPSILSNKEEM